MSDMRQLQKQVHDTAVRHGWWEDQPSFPEVAALIHSEVSEAVEEYRKGMYTCKVYYEDGKPMGIPIEMADAVIRIMDYCEHAGIDLDYAICLKARYNQTRPYRHGGKVI